MVIRHLEKTKITGALLGFGKTFLSASCNIFLMSVLTSKYDPRAPTPIALKEERKTLRKEEELIDMEENTEKKEEPSYPVMSPAQFNQAVIRVSSLNLFFLHFLGRNTLNLPSLWRLSFGPFRSRRRLPTFPFIRSGLDLPTFSLVAFLSPSSSPKLPSNPASADETPASPLKLTNNPTTKIPDVTSPPSTGLQFSTSLPENDRSKPTENFPHLVPFYLIFDPFSHAPITLYCSLIILPWDVTIAVNIIIFTQAEPNDLVSINTYNNL